MDKVLFLILGLVIGIAAGIIFMRVKPIFGLKARTKVKKLLKEAEIRSDQIIRNAQLDAKAITLEMKVAAEKEIKEKKQEVSQQENKLLQREQSIDRRDIALQNKENILDQKIEAANKKSTELDNRERIRRKRWLELLKR